jgi:hypothetical protein
MISIFCSTGAGLGSAGAAAPGLSRAATSGRVLRISSSRYSAVILSSELDGTLAAAMPKDFAAARISLFSKPSFFEIS